MLSKEQNIISSVIKREVEGTKWIVKLISRNAPKAINNVLNKQKSSIDTNVAKKNNTIITNRQGLHKTLRLIYDCCCIKWNYLLTTVSHLSGKYKIRKFFYR